MTQVGTGEHGGRTSKPIHDLDLINGMNRRRETCIDVAWKRHSGIVRIPPCTQNIRSSITTDSVRKSNISVKYVQTWDVPYFRTHSV